MFQRYAVQLFVPGVILWLCSATATSTEAVPEWFRTNPSQPYAIFDAWKQLSTRDAWACLGENWKVLAGQLRNDRGEPMPNSPITMERWTVLRHYSAALQTDDHGYFIIYAPYELQLGPTDPDKFGDLDSCLIFAAPGFPNSQPGRAFAQKCKAWRQCRSELVEREKEQTFYILTCEDQAAFHPDDFKSFEIEHFSQRYEPRKAWRANIKEPDGKPFGEVRFLDIRVVDDAGRGIPNALVQYYLAGIDPTSQNRATDDDGSCKLEEWPRPGRVRTHRILTIDAPNFGVGPVPFDPKPDTVNLIRLAKPAKVMGRVTDANDIPVSTELTVTYKRLSTLSFETLLTSEKDGTFQFERIMPNEEFRVVTRGFDIAWNQAVSARSKWMTLAPGAVSDDVKLQIRLPAALRGVVVTERGELVPTSSIGGDRPDMHLSLDFGPRDGFPENDTRCYVGTNSGSWGPSDGRFGFYGLDDRPFRIRVHGWEVDPAEPIQLEPGELRFVRVVLRKKLSADR